MPNLISLDNLYLILAFVVPGLIALFVRAQFVTGRSPPHTAAMLSYMTISAIYYALALPFAASVWQPTEPGTPEPLAWFGLVFVGPAVFGLLLGINIQQGLLRRILRWCGLNPVHVMPTAWDWKFGGMKEQWVLVTLKDGTRFAGFCGKNSFMSSDPAERDLYIQWIYDIDDCNNWSSRGDNSVLIAASEIRTIEFWPYHDKETKREQKGSITAAPQPYARAAGLPAPTDDSAEPYPEPAGRPSADRA